MKKTIILSTLAACTLACPSLAQDFDTKPVVNVENESKDLKFTAGARVMADAAYYHTDYSKMKSGAAITDARIRTSLTYKDWYLYADFNFAGGRFSQKNLFLQYNMEDGAKGHHSIKAGYYQDPTSMDRNTSLGSLHFISRAASSLALSAERELGVSYKYYNKHVFLNQGVFAENKYNDQIAGGQGFTVGGRWLYIPLNDENQTLHIGADFRFARVNTGSLSGISTGNDVKQTGLHLGTPMETNVDQKEFVGADIPWAHNVIDAGAEALYRNRKMFIRGEYMMRHITKKRDDMTLFTNQLGGMWSWTDLASWQKGNPIGSNTFHGGYVEAGYMLFGDGYRYSNADGLLKGLDGKALEIVARYNYVGLNDLVKGEYYLAGRDQYYPGGVVADYPATSLSIGGGNMHTFTLGVNYAFNRFVQAMFEYSYHKLDKDKYPEDKNFHTLQARLMFVF